jgi:NAD(P)H-flavin reductase/ferredoxin
VSFKIQIQGSDEAFDCASSENLLDAAMRQGIEMPYSCRKGVCGNCKGRVVHGELVLGTQGGSHETGVNQPDEHLFCRAQPASDLSIDPTSWHRVDPNARKIVQAKLFKKIQLASDVTQLQLRFSAGVRVKFKAGQYLQLLLPDGQRRSYSMANAPHESDSVQLHIRNLPRGYFSDTMLKNIQIGDLLKVELPHGDFWLREDSERPLLMVAGGTGFAPIKSILDHIIRQKLQRKVHLYWGAREQEGIYANDLLARWSQQSPSWVIHPVLSELPDGSIWKGRLGFVHEAVQADFENLNDWDVYACGGMPMVTALRGVCKQLGLPDANFYSDVFVI